MRGGFDAFQSLPELRKKVLFTLFMLIVCRVGIHIPVPGVNGKVLAEIFSQARGTLLGLFDMFTGGGLYRLSVFALGVMPYISVAIIMELLTAVVPKLEELKKEGELGRRKINQYTRYGTVILSFFQGFGISFGLETMRGPTGALVVMAPGWPFRLMTAVTLCAGSVFLMWIGEQITQKGIGEGISLIIFAGIVARVPAAIINTVRLVRSGELNVIFLIVLLAFMFFFIAFIVYMEGAQRRIPVQYARRVSGRRVYGGQSTHLPIKLNTSGVIPPIFASSVLMFPATIANFYQAPFMKKVSAFFSPSNPIYVITYVVLIIFFAYFYTAIIFNPVDVADNLKKFGGYIPGIRPGKKTAEYIDRVLTRLTFWGGLYLSLVCVIPIFLMRKFNVPFYFGGTALLIVVGVALDTIQRVESHLIMRRYESLLGDSKIRGRRYI